MKQKKGLIFLLVFLLVLCAVYFGMRSMNEQKKEKQTKKEKENIIQVVKIKNPVEISYSSQDGKSMTFVKENKTWYLKEDRAMKMQQTAVQTIVDRASDIKAERKIKNPDSIASYGLDQPAYTITVTGKDGNSETIYIGNGAEENYYMSTGDKTQVYTVASDLIDSLEFDKETLKEPEKTTEQ